VIRETRVRVKEETTNIDQRQCGKQSGGRKQSDITSGWKPAEREGTCQSITYFPVRH